MASFSVAVAGLGYFSQFHLDAWLSNDNVSLQAVCDPDSNKASEASAQWHCKGYQGCAELLASHKIDILDIVAPPEAHADLITMALDRVPLIICQKPFCSTFEAAKEVVALAEHSSTELIIHENFRFQPWYRTIKTLLDQDMIGHVHQCRFNLRPGDGRGSNAYLARQPSFQTMPRFLFKETGVHFVDVFTWLFGSVEAIYADHRQRNPVLAGEDCGILILDHRSGVQSIFDGNRLLDHRADNLRRTMGEMWIEGEKGTLTLDGYGRLAFRCANNNAYEDIPLLYNDDTNSFGGGCVKALIDSAVEALDSDGAYENRARDYLQTMRLVELAYESADTGSKQVVSNE